MSALTKARPRRERGSTPGNNFTYWGKLPLKGSVVVYVGAAIGILGGYIRPVVSGDTSMRVLGVYTPVTAYPGGNTGDPTTDTIDSTGEVDGAMYIDKVKRGIFGFSISADDPVTIVDVGAVVYFEDDNTIAKSSGLVNPVNPKGGILYDIEGGLAYVELGELPL